MRILLFLSCLLSILGCQKKYNASETGQRVEGMVWVSGATFIMGTNDKNSYPQERPAHPVSVDGFWIDETEVTNAQFQEFVNETNYVTVAERKPDWEQLKMQVPPGTPKPPDSLLTPGSLVFSPPTGVVSLNDYSQWWRWTAGADWKHPEGPGSNIEQRMNHPVVQVAWEDAVVYCKWADKRLPTEAEWELAARAGDASQPYVWHDELNVNGQFAANTFQGSFPNKELVEDGFSGTAPVKSFPPNKSGLYDIIGNVWEWTSDWYDFNYFETLANRGLVKNPSGPEQPYDPYDPYAKKRVMKGGSYLCASNYCVNYRPTARQGTAFDSGSSNIGFRCVKDNP